MQKQFVGWLAQKLQARDEQDLRDKMQKMGQNGIKQAYQAFMQEQQQGAADNSQDASATPMQRLGGKLDYIRCLQAFKRGGKMEMDKCGCGGKMQDGGVMGEMNEKQSPKTDWMKKRKHQTGGNIQPSYFTAPNPNGVPGTAVYGSNLPVNGTRNYPLHPSAGSAINQINDQHLTHLRQAVPNFDRVIGQPGAAGYGPEQSDNLRKIMAAYPMPGARPTGAPIAASPISNTQTLATHKSGGAMGKRKDFNSAMQHKRAIRKDQALDEHSQGERNDSGSRNHAQGSRKDFSEMGNQKGSRGDIEAMPHNHGKRLEGKKKVKNYVGFAKGGKMDPKNCQDGDTLTAKKGARISAADKKDIMLKKMDMKKPSKAMGGSFQPVSTPANASQRMAGKGKKSASQPTPMQKLGGLLLKK